MILQKFKTTKLVAHNDNIELLSEPVNDLQCMVEALMDESKNMVSLVYLI